jgi:hypothetical protein
MDEKTAWDLFNAGQPLDVVINKQRFDGVMISGLNLPGGMTLLLRTRVGEPDRHLTVAIDRVEVAPKEK